MNVSSEFVRVRPSYVAAQIMGGTGVTIEDMRKIVSSVSGSTRAVDILERAKVLANDNRVIAVH